MPFYTGLKSYKNDNQEIRSKKQRIASTLNKLQSAIKAHMDGSGSEPDHRNSVKIATWNLREFGGSTYGGRDFEPLYYIAEIISHFDIVALQEIRADLTEFRLLKRILGPDWDYIATDVTDGDAGNGERMVFLFNRRQVQFTHIAGELTLKEGGKIRAAFGERIKLSEDLKIRLPEGAPSLSGTYAARIKKAKDGSQKLNRDLEIPLPPRSILELPDGTSLVITKNTKVLSPSRGKVSMTIPDVITNKNYRMRFSENTFDDALRQFARTPYLLSFQAGWLKINLCTVHIYYGDTTDPAKLEQRRSEIEQLTAAMAEKAKGEFKHDHTSFLGVLGDFNIIGEGHPTMEALESSGFLVPEKLKSIPGSNVARDKAYDQIAFWKPSRVTDYTRLDILSANVFDYFKHVYTHDDEAVHRSDSGNGLKPTSKYSTWRTYKMSDHLPMWIELRTDFSEEYLKKIETG
ncbi:MAG: endonuclease/exonuclease/phosphatase family protein [Desulfobulbaceae bacterium]|nr:endonuclease/exonuclease/phosphatase family protein [Desulfobulbaceae bacterium]